jgi:hypothetical protein
VPGYLEVGPAAEFLQQGSHGAVLELDDRATVGADQVVVMRLTRLAAHIRVAAIGAVQAVEHVLLDQDIERAKHRCAADI